MGSKASRATVANPMTAPNARRPANAPGTPNAAAKRSVMTSRGFGPKVTTAMGSRKRQRNLPRIPHNVVLTTLPYV